MMKRLEGEVTALLAELGEEQGALSLAGLTVDPHQFLGIELNPWAAAVAELVLWIGYLQWHFRTHGKASPSEPVLRDFRNIENRDAVLTFESTKARLDDAGQPVTRWDGESTVRHPVTGESVPDPQARVAVLDYIKPRPAIWPEADFIIGNPPFIGNKRMRDALGDGYAEALRAAYPKIPQSADFVMYWWDKAALAARGWKPATEKSSAKGTRRFGLITTNSLRQTFNRKVLEPHLADPKSPLSLAFAIPDHPWVDSGDGAAVRIAMTVAERGKTAGRLLTIAEEIKRESDGEGRSVRFETQIGKIFANLRTGADVAGASPLRANGQIAYQGVIPGGDGFFVTAHEAKVSFAKEASDGLVRRYLNGREFVAFSEPRYILDFTGLDENRFRTEYPGAYQRILDTVKPVRDGVKRASRRDRWWIYSEPNVTMRPMFTGIQRYIATCRTAKHRVFGFVDANILPDAKLIAIGLDDGWHLSVLSSGWHTIWALATGAFLEDRPNYNHAETFNKFPFPEATEAHKARLRVLGEQLDAHRKTQHAANPKLTLTAMYNVLEKLRAGQRIEGKDREIYDQGLVGILRDLHDQIDAAVADAYSWPADLSDDEILHRLVDLNKQRAAEEARGHVRWLRPEYQNPAGQQAMAKGEQGALDIGPKDTATKAPWPKSLPKQIAAVQAALADLGEATPEQVARQFQRARSGTVQPLLESLSALGHARQTEGGRFAA